MSVALTEIWTPVKYLDGDKVLRTSPYFEISSRKRVRDYRGKIMKLDPRSWVGTKQNHYPAWNPDPLGGRLVGLHYTCLWSFSKPPNEYTSHVDHIDGDYENWTLDNLRWSNPCLNHLNETRARGYVVMRRKRHTVYKPWACCCGRAYYMDPVSTPEEAHELYKKIRAEIFKKVEPLFLQGKSLMQVRGLLEGWAPTFTDVQVKEFQYGQWHPGHKRRRSSPAPARPSPPQRLSYKTVVLH